MVFLCVFLIFLSVSGSVYAAASELDVVKAATQNTHKTLCIFPLLSAIFFMCFSMRATHQP